MASVVYQKDNRSGITYAYQSVSYWDKEKKQSRAKRTLIGRVDPETKKIIPTDGRGRRVSACEVSPRPGPVPITQIHRSFYGASYLLDQIGKITGVETDLKACFPNTYQRILSIAYFLILEEHNSLSRFSHWQKLQLDPFGKIFPPNGVVNYSNPLKKRREYASFKNRANDVWRRNTGRMISRQSPVIPSINAG